MQLVIFSGEISILTPNCSRTCEDPDLEDNALLPCFAIMQPAPAATKIAAVEIL